MIRTSPRSAHRSRRLLSTAALVALLVTSTSACVGTWGLRSSYRQYVTSPVAHGSIQTTGGATWTDGPGTGKGPFQWLVDFATFDAGTESGTVQFKGGVLTSGHPVATGSVLETSFWNPRLEFAGDTGTLYVDVNYRPFEGTAPAVLPPLQAALDVPFATVDLAGVDWTPDANGALHITQAPMVGITAAMELIGWDDFYGDPVTLDPLSVAFNPTTMAPTLGATPTIVVSHRDGLEPGDTITVWGSGFDPAANPGARPPLAGQPAGAYVIFGKFGDIWQPSQGAPSSSRVVVAQRWALPAASKAVVDPSGTNPGVVEIDEHGRFEATLTVAENPATGAYGVYTYPGSGAVNAAYELSVPVTLSS